MDKKLPHPCPNPWHMSGYTDQRYYLVCPECPPDRSHLAVAELLDRVRVLERKLRVATTRPVELATEGDQHAAGSPVPPATGTA